VSARADERHRPASEQIVDTEKPKATQYAEDAEEIDPVSGVEQHRSSPRSGCYATT